jgi:hypothetical protein
MKTKHLSVNSVCFLKDGRIFKVLEKYKSYDHIMVQFMEEKDPVFLDPRKLDVVEFKDDFMASFIFESIRSIHIRLNKLSDM